MSKLPVISGVKLIRILEKNGFVIVRQSGSHAQLQGVINNKIVLTTVQNTNKTLAPYVLNSIIKKQLQITREEFLKLF